VTDPTPNANLSNYGAANPETLADPSGHLLQPVCGTLALGGAPEAPETLGISEAPAAGCEIVAVAPEIATGVSAALCYLFCDDSGSGSNSKSKSQTSTTSYCPCYSDPDTPFFHSTLWGVSTNGEPTGPRAGSGSSPANGVSTIPAPPPWWMSQLAPPPPPPVPVHTVPLHIVVSRGHGPVDKVPTSVLTPHKPTLCTGSCGVEHDPNAVPAAPLGVDDASPQQDGQVSVSNAFPTDAGPDVAPEPDPSGGSARSGDSCVGNDGGRTLFHYTTEEAQKRILESGQLNPSLKADNPSDARYGNGQYLTNIAPGTKTGAQLSRALVGNPFQGARFTHYLGIDVTGLNVVEGRAAVFLVPNDEPLDLSGRIVDCGANQ
jgi:hypothetical protein